MNKNEQEWLDYYIESGDAVKAVAIAYPDVSEASRPSKASQLKARLAMEVHQASIEQYGKEAPFMMNVLRDLAKGAKQEAVKLKAASEWLTRAKHDAPLQVEVTDKKTYEQLQNQLSELIQTIGDNELKALGLERKALETLTKQDHDQTDTRH